MYGITQSELNFALETIGEIIETDEVHPELAEVAELLREVLNNPLIEPEEAEAA